MALCNLVSLAQALIMYALPVPAINVCIYNEPMPSKQTLDRHCSNTKAETQHLANSIGIKDCQSQQSNLCVPNIVFSCEYLKRQCTFLQDEYLQTIKSHIKKHIVE